MYDTKESSTLLTASYFPMFLVIYIQVVLRQLGGFYAGHYLKYLC